MDSLVPEIFCEITTYLSPHDLLRLGLINQSLRRISRSQTVWQSYLGSRKLSNSLPGSDFYLDCIWKDVDVVVIMAGLVVDDKFLSKTGEHLVDYANKKRSRAILQAIQGLTGIPPLFLVDDASEWGEPFSSEEAYGGWSSETNREAGLELLASIQRYAQPEDDIFTFHLRNGGPCESIASNFQSSPNFCGKHGLTPLFLKESIGDLLEMGSDPAICDVMGRNAVFAAVSEICSIGNDDSEEPASLLGDYLEHLGKKRLRGLMANGSGLTAFQHAKLQGNPNTLDFLSENFPKETKAAKLPEVLLKPLSLMKKLAHLFSLDESERFVNNLFYAVGTVPNNGQLLEFLNDTAIRTLNVFPWCFYEHVGEGRSDFGSDEYSWEVSELGEDEESFWETFEVLREDAYYHDQAGDGDARIFGNDKLLPGHTLYFLVVAKYEK